MIDTPALAQVEALVGAIPDPEIPVVTLRDLGILRSVRIEQGRAHVVLTPTYSGCPATEAIRDEVLAVLREAGHPDAEVTLALSPAWTTDWISDEGRRKLRDYGIAPPGAAAGAHDGHGVGQDVLRFRPKASLSGPACPRCDSPAVELLSQWGSTPCKALYRCRDCAEPFDYFKPY